jgi:hypothetical protein
MIHFTYTSRVDNDRLYAYKKECIALASTRDSSGLLYHLVSAAKAMKIRYVPWKEYVLSYITTSVTVSYQML